ncbi:MAG: GntR family transcriptional regulator [Thermobacillus sp.]|uniref:GntR family transcriptional regulator n=1 Tax=Thermobacillus sp. TaxID=2108467 RepID=UPI000E3A751E|nr:GntR family transcriptional regulator [Thermobacillus sp.]REK56159.1 MAG: GntR family transcriptional regulator [Thermobacillus sp.]
MTRGDLPKYLQLKQEILSWLHSGEWKPHELLPSENELAARFGMSRQTVRQTLNELEQEGYLYRQRGKGTFVAPPDFIKAGAAQAAVGMVTTYISDYIFPHIVRGAEAVLRAHGMGLYLSSTDNDKQREQGSLQMMMNRGVGGLIVEPTKSAEGNPNLEQFLAFRYRGIPVVMINARYPELDCPCLVLDDEAGGFAATEHLIKLGHRRIAGFFKTDDLQGTRRMKGFLRAMKHYGVPMLPDGVVTYASENKWSRPAEAAAGLLRRNGRPTAFVCYNDELAVALLPAIRAAGLAVPDDLSIVGFDDSTLAQAAEVKLTTLTHPKTAMGERAAEMLLRLMADPSAEAEDVTYAPELVVRDSTRAIGEETAV